MDVLIACRKWRKLSRTNNNLETMIKNTYLVGIILLLTVATACAHSEGHRDPRVEAMMDETSLKTVAELEGNFIRLVAGLDEPEEFYCFDLAGWGKSLQLDAPIQTHTCKRRNAADQMFAFSDGRLEVSGYDRCVFAGGSSGRTLPGSAVLARECSDSSMQKFSLQENGTIRLADSNYCIAAGPVSEEANGPSHMWRTLTIESCDGDTSLLQWQVGVN